MESTFLFLRNLCSLLILDLQLRLSSKLPQRRMRLCSFATFIMPRSRGLVSKKMWQLMTVEEWKLMVGKWSWFLSLRLVYPVLRYRRELPSLLDLLSEFGLISDVWLGLYISFGRLSQCTWVLKVSVLETGHTRYCSTSGSDPLRQLSLIWALSLNPNIHPSMTVEVSKSIWHHIWEERANGCSQLSASILWNVYDSLNFFCCCW